MSSWADDHRRASAARRALSEVAHVHSQLSITRKNDVGALDALTRLFSGDPWSDSRAGALPEFDVEDAYFTRVRFHAAAAQASRSGFDVESALAGSGAALAVAGLAC